MREGDTWGVELPTRERKLGHGCSRIERECDTWGHGCPGERESVTPGGGGVPKREKA